MENNSVNTSQNAKINLKGLTYLNMKFIIIKTIEEMIEYYFSLG